MKNVKLKPRTSILIAIRWQNSKKSSLINALSLSPSLQEINHYSRGGGVFIITEHNVTTITSQLLIKNLTMADSGQYSCSTSAKNRTSVKLNVSNGNFANGFFWLNDERISIGSIIEMSRWKALMNVDISLSEKDNDVTWNLFFQKAFVAFFFAIIEFYFLFFSLKTYSKKREGGGEG